MDCEIKLVIEGPRVIRPAVLFCNDFVPGKHESPLVLDQTAVYITPYHNADPILIDGKRKSSILRTVQKHLDESTGCAIENVFLMIDNVANRTVLLGFNNTKVAEETVKR